MFQTISSWAVWSWQISGAWGEARKLRGRWALSRLGKEWFSWEREMGKAFFPSTRLLWTKVWGQESTEHVGKQRRDWQFEMGRDQRWGSRRRLCLAGGGCWLWSPLIGGFGLDCPGNGVLRQVLERGAAGESVYGRVQREACSNWERTEWGPRQTPVQPVGQAGDNYTVRLEDLKCNKTQGTEAEGKVWGDSEVQLKPLNKRCWRTSVH